MNTILRKLKGKSVSISKKVIRFFLTGKYNRKHISGNGIKSLCDLEIKNLKLDYSSEIMQSRRIFINSEIVENFLELYHEILSDKTVIAGNSDMNFSKISEFMNSPKTLYLQNLGFSSNARIKLLPIGLENYEHVRSGFSFLHKQPRKFKFVDKVLIPPMSATNPVRAKVLSEAHKYPSVILESRYLGILSYMRLVRQYKYVLVCEGNGYDTHRLWEVLYQGSIPIVFKSEFSNNLAKLGLPVVQVSDLSEITHQLLMENYTKYKDFKIENNPFLWLDGWRNLLES